MLIVRLALILATLASAQAHTRGAANWDDENSLASTHREASRFLMSKDKKKKNLAGDPGGTNNGGGNNGKKSGGMGGGGGNDRKPNNQGGGNGASDNNGGGSYVAEEHACIPFNDEMQGRASLSLSDDACRTNSCGGGCCRIYHWLICDTGDEMPQLSCVCNENTRPPPTDPPTTAPPTPTPTAVATPAATPATPVPTATVSSDQRNPDEVQYQTPAATPATTPGPTTKAPVDTAMTQPDFIGGAAADSCTSGSPHHNNPLFRGFTKCFGADDCPLSTECCIHSFCFCGEPDDWSGDCVARTQK